MRKTLVVALREYLAAVKTKTFVVTLVIMPVLLGGSVFMEWLLRDYHDTRPRKFAIVDRTPGASLYPSLVKTVDSYNERTVHPTTHKPILPRFELELTPASKDTPEAIAQQRLDLSERVRKGELFGFLDIGSGVLKPDQGDSNPLTQSIRYQSNRPTNRDFQRLIEKPLTLAIQTARMADAHLGVSLETIQQIVRPANLEVVGLMQRDPGSGDIKDETLVSRYAPIGVPIGFVMLMFMVIMMTATPLMQGVVEEKMQRIAEVLLGSVPPFELMLGKLLGMTAVSLTIAIVYLAGAYVAARQYGFDKHIPLDLLAWFIIFQGLAALMYGSLFIAIGAACTDMKETQNLLWPVLLLAMLPMFLMGSALEEPNSVVAVSLSFFPFSTPMLMILRQSVPPGVPSWQPMLGVVSVMAMTLLCVWAAGRIFRIGILMQGKGARLGEMLRWVFHD